MSGQEILTYHGIWLDPFCPQVEQLQMEDIAHALSMTCRAGGHIRHFYSVAQHLLNCADEAAARGHSVRVQLACLLHDGSECYIADITRPVKSRLPEYQAVEAQLQRAVYAMGGLGSLREEEQAQVDAVDDALLYHEFLQLRGIKMFETAPALVAALDFSARSMCEVKQALCLRYAQLKEQLNTAQFILNAEVLDDGWR